MPHFSIPQDAPLKTCAKCGEDKPATNEYFSRDTRSNREWQSWCKTCRALRARELYAEKKGASVRQYRRDDSESPAERRRKSRLARQETLRAYNSKWRNEHPEYARNWKVMNAEREAQYQRVYSSANSEKKRAQKHNRRALERGADGWHTREDIQIQYERQKGKCYWCGEKVDKGYHVDHVVPLSRGGSNWPDNLVIACPSCNQSKSDKLPHEWIEGGRLL